MTPRCLVLATRKSRLARRQTEEVVTALAAVHKHLDITLLALSTRGDEIRDRALAPLGGKGLFVNRLEEALAAGRAQLAVHSLKDVPSELAPAFTLAAIPARRDPRDVLITHDDGDLSTLKHGARVGTASLRRQAQLLHARPDLDIVLVRGSVETRLAKLDAGELDATVLAAAGLSRLGIQRGTPLAPEVMLPAPGQGTLAVEARANDEETIALAAALENRAARVAATAERTFCRTLGATCTSPVGALAAVADGQVTLTVRILPADGSDQLAAEDTTATADAETLGARLAETLLAQGAARWLEDDGRT
ncbi:MAG: hydroxymethylbilane synthase [Gammaproteobacteria bacterium]